MSYKKGTFGYWWTVIKGNDDIKGKVYDGSINCSYNNLTSLEGAPKVVKGYFDCFKNNLVSLEGGPESVDGSFSCDKNKLQTLKGSPKIIKAAFSCSNNNLTTLEGGPKIVNGDFYCINNNIVSLKGAPEKVIMNFDIHNNSKLESLEGLPKYIGGFINLYKCPKLTVNNIYQLFDSDIKGKVISDLMTSDEFKKEQKLYKKLGREKYLKIKKLQDILK